VNKKPKRQRQQASDSDALKASVIGLVRQKIVKDGAKFIEDLPAGVLAKLVLGCMSPSVEPKVVEEAMPQDMQEFARGVLEKEIARRKALGGLGRPIEIEITDTMISRMVAELERYAEAVDRIIAGDPD
jgi:hypothetical protein